MSVTREWPLRSRSVSPVISRFRRWNSRKSCTWPRATSKPGWHTLSRRSRSTGSILPNVIWTRFLQNPELLEHVRRNPDYFRRLRVAVRLFFLRSGQALEAREIIRGVWMLPSSSIASAATFTSTAPIFTTAWLSRTPPLVQRIRNPSSKLLPNSTVPSTPIVLGERDTSAKRPSTPFGSRSIVALKVEENRRERSATLDEIP